MPAPTPRPGIMDIVAYKPGSAGSPATKIYKLSSNESALGPSPKAIAAFKAVADDLHIYPDAGASALRAAVAAEFSIDEGLVVAGAGSDEILTLLMRGYLGPGDSMVMSRHGFAIYAIATTGCGAEVIRADEENLTTHVDNLLAAVKPNTKMMMLANPNNPTGTLLSGAQLRRLRKNLRDDILLVLDAAYAEYVEADDYEDGIGMVGAAIKSGADNVFTTRTFSKLYGLGGLRVGWGYGPRPVVDVLNRLRGPRQFILSESGHIAGIVNPPSKKKYGHYTNPDLSLPHDQWKETADFNEGSWWPRWGKWLAKRSGKQVPARDPGDSAHPELCPAPGTYVLVRANN